MPKRSTIFEFTPSIVWGLVMLGPFTLHSLFGPSEFPPEQLIGLSLISAAILLSDLFAFRHSPLRHSTAPLVVSTRQLEAGLVICVGLFTLHLLLMPEVPLLAFSSGRGSFHSNEMIALREQSSKLLQVPKLFLYACQSCLNIVMPIIVTAYLARGRMMAVVLTSAGALFYGLATLAKSPTLSWLCVTGALIFLYGLAPRLERKFWLIGSIFLLTCLVTALGLSQSPFHLNWEPNRVQNQVDTNFVSSAADDYRRAREQGEQHTWNFLSRINNYLVYRAFLVPSEVSANWYNLARQGKLDRDAGPFTLKDLSSRHRANKVCEISYQSRYPKRYLDSCSAYASLDADAYALGGTTLVFLTGVAVLLLRTLLVFACMNRPGQIPLYVAFVTLFALQAPQAPLLAMLAAQGLGLAAALILASRVLRTPQVGER